MTLEKYSEKYWLDKILNAQKAREDYFNEYDLSVATYTGDTKSLKSEAAKHLKDIKRKINCWSTEINTLLPAYYSQKPDIECNLRHDKEPPAFLLAALISEKVANYQIDEENDIYPILYHFVLSYALGGQGVLWNRYEVEKQKEEITYLDDEGNTVVEEVEKVVHERVILESVCVKDYLCSSGRKEDELIWEAKRAFMGREEAEARFGADAIKDVNFDLIEENDQLKDAVSDDEDNEYQLGDKAAFWEIWCHETKKVYWLSTSAEGKGKLIEESDPPVTLASFSPCSVLLANKSPESMIPTSDFTLCKDSILEVERLTERIHSCSEGIRLNALYDSMLGDEVQSLWDGDFRWTPVTNSTITEMKRISDGIYQHNIQPYVDALPVLLDIRDRELDVIKQQTGSIGLLTANADPRESATASLLKNSRTSLRFTVRQRHIAEAIEKSFNQIGEIVSEQFEPETIIEISNAFDLIPHISDKNPKIKEQSQPQPGQPQQPQIPTAIEAPDPNQLVAEAISILQDDFARRFNISIKTDSMVAMDEAQNRAERMELLDKGINAIKDLGEMGTMYPDSFDVVKYLAGYALRTFKGHKEIEPHLMTVFDSIKAKAEEMQANNKPQPDPQIIQSQTQLQIAQLNQQTAMQKNQVEMARLQASRESEQLQTQVRMEQMRVEQANAQVEQGKVQVDQLKAEIERLKAQGDEQELQVRMASEVDSNNLEREKMALRREEIALDKYKIDKELEIAEMESAKQQFNNDN